ncbi:MAG: (deoxy)nucleoside triphosphate pyrophosphohydrolase [Bdellovibrionota bacterium]
MTNVVRPLLVTAAIILSPDGRVLLAQRKADASLEALKWEFPGGKLEAFEHPEDCIRREIQEELALEIRVERVFDVASHFYIKGEDRRHIILLCYLCRADTLEFQIVDVADARWVTPDELGTYDFAAADIPLVSRLIEWFRRG